AFPGDSSYAASSGASSLTVTPASLNVTANDKTRQYGIANPALDATITGFKNGETLGTSDVTGSASCTTTANSGSLVGNYTITCTAGSLTSHNYTFMFAPGTLHVTQAALTVTADAQSKVYGAGNPALTYIITGFVNGDAASVVSGTANCSTTATLLSGVGGYSITCTQGTLSATNYTFSFVGDTLTVTQATLTVTANNQAREYGDPNPGFDATITGFKNGQNLTTSGVSGTASCSSSATMTSPVADYSITCTIGGLLSGNYSFTFFAPGTLHVTKAVLAVAADEKWGQYGDANPAFDATISGVKNGENVGRSDVTRTAS